MDANHQKSVVGSRRGCDGRCRSITAYDMKTLKYACFAGLLENKSATPRDLKPAVARLIKVEPPAKLMSKLKAMMLAEIDPHSSATAAAEKAPDLFDSSESDSK